MAGARPGSPGLLVDFFDLLMDRIELEESSGLIPVADLRPRMTNPRRFG